MTQLERMFADISSFKAMTSAEEAAKWKQLYEDAYLAVEQMDAMHQEALAEIRRLQALLAGEK